MKHFFSFVLVLMLSVSLYAQEPFFCMKIGVINEYVNKDADGKVINYFTGEVVEVTGDFVNGSISFVYNFFDSNRKPLFSPNNEMDMKVALENGSTIATISEMKKATKSQTILAKGDVSSLPFEMKKGDTIKDGFIEIHVKAIKSTMSITERKVVAEESVTTPAGTFDSVVLQEKQVDKVLGITTTSYMKSWMVKGMGVVRQEISDKNHKLITVQELIKTTLP